MFLSSKNVYIDGQFIPRSIEIIDNKIVSINDYGKGEDLGDNYLVPGFIDIHTHGGYGFEVMSADKGAGQKWLSNLIKEGTTSVLLTPYTSSLETMRQSAVALKSLKKDPKLCEIVGVHLEGPFISKKALGAMNEKYVIAPDIKVYQELVDGYEEDVKIVTMAIEEDKDKALLKHLQDKGIRVSCGHTTATFEECKEATRYGLNGFTHTYNAMKGFHHREVGTVGASMLLDECYSECIVDGKHVCFEALKVLFKVKPHEKIIFVTDSLSAKGLMEGIYDLDGLAIRIKDGLAYLDGTDQIAGSTIGLDGCVQNAVKHADMRLEDAIAAVSINPAKYIGVDQRKGSISIGKDADLCVLDEELKVERTYKMGKLVYSRSN